MSTLIATRASSVEAVIRSAWRRRLFVLIVQELGLASSILFSGAIVMLLAGTQLLEWYWLVLLTTGGVAAGAFRVQRKIVNLYAVAQKLDDRLELNDSLSTAWFLLTSNRKFDQVAAEYQIGRAGEIAQTVQAATAFPLKRQRSWTVAGALGCALLALFAIRYLVIDSLDLRPPLVSLRFRPFADNAVELKVQGKKNAALSLASNREILPSEFRSPGAESARNLKSASAKDAKHGQSSNGQGDQNISSKSAHSGDPRESSGGEAAERGTRGERQSPGDDLSKQAQQAESRGSEQQQSPGLLDKMKDALSGIMAKMRQNSSSQNQPRDGRNASSGDKRNGQAATGKDETGQSSDARQQRPDASSDAQGQTQTAEKSARVGADSDQGPQGKGSDSQSGAGRQDGEKSLTDAEQLKAMGRLAEIIGKRSASLTGEMTVEKSSGQQQLQTQYSQKTGHHSDLGGEINRDEIPFEYRDYVREYMTEVHKQAETKH